MITLLILFDVRYIIFHFYDLKSDIIKIWHLIKPYLDFKLLLCYLPFWFVATGWAWLFSIIGRGVARAVAISWLAFMWLPFNCEKVVTIPLSIWLYKKLFKKENKQLNKMLERVSCK